MKYLQVHQVLQVLPVKRQEVVVRHTGNMHGGLRMDPTGLSVLTCWLGCISFGQLLDFLHRNNVQGFLVHTAVPLWLLYSLGIPEMKQRELERHHQPLVPAYHTANGSDEPTV